MHETPGPARPPLKPLYTANNQAVFQALPTNPYLPVRRHRRRTHAHGIGPHQGPRPSWPYTVYLRSVSPRASQAAIAHSLRACSTYARSSSSLRVDTPPPSSLSSALAPWPPLMVAIRRHCYRSPAAWASGACTWRPHTRRDSPAFKLVAALNGRSRRRRCWRSSTAKRPATIHGDHVYVVSALCVCAYTSPSPTLNTPSLTLGCHEISPGMHHVVHLVHVRTQRRARRRLSLK